jgi:hypothetical protein
MHTTHSIQSARGKPINSADLLSPCFALRGRDDELFNTQQINHLKDSIDALTTDSTKGASCPPSDVACMYLSYKSE